MRLASTCPTTPAETSRSGGCARHASSGLLAGSDGTQAISRKNHIGCALNIHCEAVSCGQAIVRAQSVQHRAVRTHRRRIRKPTRPVADVQIQYRADAQPQPFDEGEQRGHASRLVSPEMKLLVDLDDPVHVGRRKPPLCAKSLFQLRYPRQMPVRAQTTHPPHHPTPPSRANCASVIKLAAVCTASPSTAIRMVTSSWKRVRVMTGTPTDLLGSISSAPSAASF